MNKLITGLIFIAFSSLSNSATIAKALHCGPRGSFLSNLASSVAIPDYFPPENFLAHLFFSAIYDLNLCQENFSPVYLGKSCAVHDRCYTTYGAHKDRCDEELLAGWRASCIERYTNSNIHSTYCLNACEGVVNFMYEALRYDDGYFCPSCIAFSKDQEIARTNL
jgi:hypothetical protein